jgi:hypothetical protein
MIGGIFCYAMVRVTDVPTKPGIDGGADAGVPFLRK